MESFHRLRNPNSQQWRPAHKEYLGRVADHIAFAGPLFADDGETMQGSLLVIDFPDRAAAEAWLRLAPIW